MYLDELHIYFVRIGLNNLDYTPTLCEGAYLFRSGRKPRRDKNLNFPSKISIRMFLTTLQTYFGKMEV